MTLQNTLFLLLAAVLIIGIGIRQLRWQNLTPRSVWLMPGIITVVGLISTVGGTPPSEVTPISLGALLLELALSVGIGLAMGGITTFRRVDGEVVDGRGRRVLWQTRTGWLGLVLWVALIAVRLGVDVVAKQSGWDGLVVSSGAILLVIGANRLCRSALLQLRMSRHAFAVAG